MRVGNPGWKRQDSFRNITTGNPEMVHPYRAIEPSRTEGACLPPQISIRKCLSANIYPQISIRKCLSVNVYPLMSVYGTGTDRSSYRLMDVDCS